MLATKEIEEKLKMISRIEMIAKTYQEVANKKMKEIRQKVLNNREFIERLSEVYHLIKENYIPPEKTKKTKEKLFLKHKEGRVAVFLSSNEHFYGSLILDVWKEFSNYFLKNKTKIAVVGKIGRYLISMTNPNEKFFYFDMDDDDPKKEEIKKFINFIKKYKEVIIFHGKFHTILSQQVAQSNISGKVSPKKKLEKIKSYLFEPSEKEVLDFFETELIAAFFSQAVFEHRLSKYATRVVAMYQVTENAKKRRKLLRQEQKNLKRQLLNKKQIELFSGFSLWK